MVSAAVLLAVGGMLTVLATCPLRRVAWPFIRLLAILTFILAAMVGAWFISRDAWAAPAVWGLTAALAGAGSSFLLMVLAPLLPSAPAIVPWIRGCAIAGGTAALAGGAFLELSSGGLSGPNTELVALHWIAVTAGLLLAGFVFGTFNVGWLLGHRYLTAPDMTIDPLRRISGLVVIAMVARWMFFIAGLAAILLLPTYADAARHLSKDWLMLSIRVGVGLLLPSIGVYMTWECVRLRSTQSATGILFFTSVLIMIGELTSLYLAGPLGLPI